MRLVLAGAAVLMALTYSTACSSSDPTGPCLLIGQEFHVESVEEREVTVRHLEEELDAECVLLSGGESVIIDCPQDGGECESRTVVDEVWDCTYCERGTGGN